jgi:hypothetical protein
MARQNVGFAELLCVALPPSLIPFPFGFTLLPAWIICFLFPVFLLEKFMRSEAEQTTTGSGKREKRVSK